MKILNLILFFSVFHACSHVAAEDKAYEAWLKGAEANQKRQEAAHRKTMNTRLDELVRICQLENEQLERLSLAAKGAIERSLDAYFRYQQKQFERRRNGNRGAFPRLNPEDQNPTLQPLWINTISNELQSDQKQKYRDEMKARAQFYAESQMRNIIQQLDRESRFSAKQRAVLLEELQKAVVLPNAATELDQQRVTTVVYKGLGKVPDQPLKEVFSDSQFRAWKVYRDRYVRAYQNR